jgi:hypothetical protein
VLDVIREPIDGFRTDALAAGAPHVPVHRAPTTASEASSPHPADGPEHRQPDPLDARASSRSSGTRPDPESASNQNARLDVTPSPLSAQRSIGQRHGATIPLAG